MERKEGKAGKIKMDNETRKDKRQRDQEEDKVGEDNQVPVPFQNPVLQQPSLT